jgi:putative spermidine/putrescine transport system substrate-binding protein
MKKKLLLISMVAALMMALVACGGSGGSDGPVTINVYAGGSDNVRQAWEDLIAAFHETDTDVRVELQFIPADVGSVIDTFIASIEAGVETTDIDIMDISEGDLVRIVELGGYEALLEVTPDTVPNMSDVTVEPARGAGRGLPYRGTTVAMAYDSARVSNPPQTAEELHDWIRANPTRFAYNDPTTGGAGGAFVNTTIYNLMPEEAMTSVDESWVEHWDEGFQVLAELHPYMYQSGGRVLYPQRNQGTLDLLATGEVDIIPVWVDMALQQIGMGTLPDTVKIYQLDPPLTGQLQMAAIPAKSENHEAALELLNFVVSVQAQEMLVENMAAIPVIPADALSEETLSILTGFTTTNFRVMTIGDLGPQLQERWQIEISALD